MHNRGLKRTFATGSLGIDVNPLMIEREVGKLIHHFLGNGDLVAKRRELFSDALLQRR